MTFSNINEDNGFEQIKSSRNKKKKKRIELIFLENTDIENCLIDFTEMNIGSVYIKVNIKTISYTREFLISQGYSTRLIIIPDTQNIFYIYGRKKASKAVFNEHCKNTVIRQKDFIKHLIGTSSNIGDTVLTDFNVLEENMDRKWIKYA